MRRLPIAHGLLVLLGVIVAALGLVDVAGAAPTQADSTTTAAEEPGATDSPGTTDPGRVSIIKVEGLIDPVMAAFIERSIDEGEQAGVLAVVLQLDSPGAVVSDDRLAALARRMHDAAVPVVVWVGPSGAEAMGGAAQLAGAAQLMALAPGSHLGRTGDLVVPIELLSEEFVAAGGRLESGSLNETAVRELGLAPDRQAAVIGEFIIDLPGVETRVVEVDGVDSRQPVSVPVFSALPIQDQLFHTVASPPVAYLLLLIGMALIIFELYTAGVGIAGMVGAGSLVLAGYGLYVLPTRPWALALLVVAMFGFAVDVQTGVPRLWSIIATVCLAAGSVFMYDGLSVSWIALLVGIVGTVLAMVNGMPAMVRTRFSTPTIGREWMIGDEGEAVTAIDPDGVVRLRGALWRARTNRATPIALHDGIRVVEVDGLLLEVEPLAGGAVDYREGRGDRGAGGADETDPSGG